MSKPLTKQAFLEGKAFYKADDKEYSLRQKRYYKYVDDKDNHPANIKAYEKYNSLSWRYEANVGTITDAYVILYTSICAQSVDKKIYFHEFILVEEELPDGTNN